MTRWCTGYFIRSTRVLSGSLGDRADRKVLQTDHVSHSCHLEGHLEGGVQHSQLSAARDRKPCEEIDRRTLTN